MLVLIIFAVPPKIANFSFDGPKEPGELAQISCLVTQGDLPVSMQWTFQGNETLNNQRGVQISKVGKKSSILTIEAEYSMNGIYSCRATNLAGTATHSAELVVMGNIPHQGSVHAFAMGAV